MTTVLVLVGSLRADSVNRAIAHSAQEAAPEGVQVRIARGLERLPFYSDDVDGPEVPETVTELRRQVADSDALLVITPEYNGGLPAVIKNAIDWASRPYGEAPIKGKPVGAIGAALSQYGGQWAQQEALKAAGIAGGAPHDEPTASLPISRLGENPAEHDEVVTALRDVLTRLADDVREARAA
ncbi:NAD(P)H-dependent oxidoreductase [Barrientosiimonas humi]|uniref:NAD(P)H-dependent oxidoreductase n=1 Tax=Barrientosiimonas humi TaxID=999931 RepID=UPI00370D3A06